MLNKEGQDLTILRVQWIKMREINNRTVVGCKARDSQEFMRRQQQVAVSKAANSKVEQLKTERKLTQKSRAFIPGRVTNLDF